MAQQVVVRKIDDLDGGEADVTTSFSVEGKSYEIDLSSANHKVFVDLFHPYMQVARKAGKAGPKAPRAERKRSAQENHEIREEARKLGHDVPDRGRIPFAVVDAVEAARAEAAAGRPPFSG